MVAAHMVVEVKAAAVVVKANDRSNGKMIAFGGFFTTMHF